MKRSRLKPRGKRPLRPTKLTPKMESALDTFWGWWGHSDSAMQIGLLLRYSSLVIGPRTASRYAFDRQKHKIKLGPCAICAEPGTDRHHILSLDNGGPNHPKNYINLCAEHHQAVHDFPIGVKR